MYAGTLFGLGEALGAGVFISSFDLNLFTATVKDVQIRYRRPAMTDVRAVASLDAGTVARIEREADATGKTGFVLDAELTDTAGVVVAVTHGTYQVRDSVDPKVRRCLAQPQPGGQGAGMKRAQHCLCGGGGAGGGGGSGGGG
jgi:hypothetical protein